MTVDLPWDMERFDTRGRGTSLATTTSKDAAPTTSKETTSTEGEEEDDDVDDDDNGTGEVTSLIETGVRGVSLEMGVNKSKTWLPMTSRRLALIVILD